MTVVDLATFRRARPTAAIGHPNRELPIGAELDAEVCRHVFRMPESEIEWLRSGGRLPPYSTSPAAALEVVQHFFRLSAEERQRPDVVRFGRFLARAAERPLDDRDPIHVVVACTCPSIVCDAALFAIGGAEAD